jgi:hypothetical protein
MEMESMTTLLAQTFASKIEQMGKTTKKTKKERMKILEKVWMKHI